MKPQCPLAYRCLLALAVGLIATHAAAQASLNQGILQFQEARYEAASATLTEVAAQEPDNIAARYWLGRAQLEAGRYGLAEQALSSVLRDMPESTEARYWFALVLARSGRVAEARTELEALIAANPGDSRAAEALAALPEATAVAANGRSAAAPTSLHGTRLALIPGGLSVDVGAVDLLSYNVADYTFSSAPTDWLSRGGIWAITNRWTCSPQWSWLGGYAEDGIASLWNKREFTGDVTVEAYLSFKMGLGAVHSYKNPTDLNISIHADGANPSSGYSFIVGADRNHDSRIMKGTQVLASSSEPAALLPIFEDGYPSTYEFHRKWWALRARKAGGKLQLFLDGKLIVEADDPEPLESGRVALWTYDKGIIISRCKIYYESEKADRSPIPGEEAIQRAITQVAPRLFNLASSTHPSVQNDFEQDLGDWRARSEQDGTILRIVAPGAGEGGHCLALTNPVSGGTFGTRIIPGDFLVDDLPRLSFDYRLPADGSARVNLYLTANGRQYELVFSGPSGGTPFATRIGAIPNVQADGEWHHAEVDLLGALRQAMDEPGAVRARDLWIGNQCEDDYLMAGFGGNHLGATFHLDNFVLDKPGGQTLKLQIAPVSGVKPTGYSVSLDENPTGDTPCEVSQTQASFEKPLQGAAVQYAHIRAKLADDTWSEPVHFRARTDTVAPRVVSVEPEPGSPLPDGPIVFRLDDQGCSGIEPASLRVSFAGRELSPGKPGVSFDPASQTLSLDARMLVENPKDGQQVSVKLATAKDRAGNEADPPAPWDYKVDFAADKTAPPVPSVLIGDQSEAIWADFEDSLGGFTTYGGSSGAELALDDTTAASGKRSLRVFNPTEGGRYGIIRRGTFDAGKYRIVSFDYKVPSRLRVDLAVYVNGDMKGIKFKDNDNNLGMIGAVPNVIDDGEWHHAEFNLYEMLRKDDPTAAGYVVDQLVIADWNWRANVEGQVYHLDNFRIVPVVSGAGGLPVRWIAPDVSGIAGIAWAIGGAEPNVPDQVSLTGLKGVIPDAGNLDGWLHTRVRDGAGNWSPVQTQRLITDDRPPQAAIAAPQEGVRAAQSTVEIKLSDEGPAGIDPGSVVLSVAGQDYTVKKLGVGGLSFDSSTGKLVWNCEAVTPRPVVLPDGKPVTVVLKSAKDYAGNPVTQLPQWSWTMDYALDKSAPMVTELNSTTHRTFLTNTFEDGLHDWRTTSGSSGAVVTADTTTAATGKTSVKVAQRAAGANMGCFITREPFAAENFPIVSFAYRLPEAVKIDLMARMENGNEYAISITDNPTGAVGRFPNIKADDKWHTTSVDIADILRKRETKGSLKVVALYLVDRNNMDNPAGVAAWFDDFTIGAVGTRTPVLRWKATDTTGIAGYSYVMDRQPSTVPDETSEGAAQSFRDSSPSLARGRWYFHVRAQDGAGNWGPATHYALMHLTAD